MTTPTIQTSPFNTDRKYDTKFIFPMAKEDNDKTFIFPSNKYIDNSEEEDDDDHYYSNSDSVIVTEYSDASESHDINLVPGDELRMKIENELKEQEKQITQNNPEITNGGSYCEINIKYDAYDGKILKLKVHDSCLIYDIKLQIDNVTNNGNALNIQYNGNVLPNNQSLKELGIGADSLLIYSNEPEIDPIEWTESDVSNWFISFGYDEFAAEEWIQQRIDGAALLLNIRGGHIRFDALVEDKQDIQDIMEEVKYLRFNSIGYQKQEIVNLKNKIYNNQKTVNKQQLSELKISRNILEIDLRKSFQQIEEFEKKMKEMEKENNKLKYKNDKLLKRMVKNEKKCKHIMNKYKITKESLYPKELVNKYKISDSDYRIKSNDTNTCIKDRNVKIIRYTKVDRPQPNIASRKSRQRRRSFVLDNGSITSLYDHADQYVFEIDNGKIC
eukprot:424537_1